MNIKNIIVTIVVSLVVIIFLLFSSKKDESSAIKFINYNFKANQKATYKLDFIQNSQVTIDKIVVKQIFKLDGFLNVKVLKKQNDIVWIVMQLSNLNIEANPKLKPFFLDKLIDIYKKPFLVKMQDSGEILEMKFSLNEKNFTSLKQAIYLLQIVNKPYIYYEVNEFDENGKYKASYEHINSYELLKTKKYYYNDLNKQNFILLSNSFNAYIDLDGVWLKKLIIDENLTTQNRDFLNRNRVTLNKLDHLKNVDIFTHNYSYDDYLTNFKNSLNKQSKKLTIWDELQLQNIKDELSNQNITLDKIKQILIDNPKDINNYLLLTKYLKVNPQDIDKLLDDFTIFDDYIQMNIISTLEYIGTKESQEGLFRLAQDNSLKDDNNIRAIIAIGSVKKPIDKSIVVLKNIMDMYRDIDSEKYDSAILALGTIKDKTKNIDLIQKIKEEYYSFDSLSKKRVILYAIENAGVDNFIDEIKDSLKSKSIKSRLLSIELLLKLKDKKLAKSILLKQLDIEQNDNVKSKIIKSLDSF